MLGPLSTLRGPNPGTVTLKTRFLDREQSLSAKSTLRIPAILAQRRDPMSASQETGATVPFLSEDLHQETYAKVAQAKDSTKPKRADHGSGE